MKYISLFSGIGAFEKALQRLGINYELVGFSEIDKYAVKSYCAIHNVPESMNLGDITKIDEQALPKNIDLVTYGFPCQDISLAGKQQGLFHEDGSQTRSGLFFEALRIIEATRPRVAIAENVKNLTSKKFSGQFKIVLDSLEKAGYNNYWQVLNAKDYGIPQNRERVFIVSIRKDIDTGFFQFPQGFPLELRLKDMLEEEVDGKYFLKKVLNMEAKENYIQYDNSGKGYNSQAMRAYYHDGLAPTLPARNGGDKSQVILVNKAEIKRIDIPQTVKVRKYPVDTNALCKFLRCAKADADLTNDNIANALDVSKTKVEHWFRRDECFAIPDSEIWMELKALLKIETDEFDESIMTFEEKEGVYEKSERHYFSEGIAPTLTSTTAAEKVIEPSLRIRKLTPKECFRLMDFDDSDFEKAEAVNSNMQLYKQAGNSIVVSCAEKIMDALCESGALRREKEEMELRIEQITFPEVIDFNFEELKQEITNRVAMYANMVYTEDQVKQAKADRANLNKFVKALSDERIKVKKQCLKPYEEFEAKVNELSKIVQEPINLIDKQVKEYEEQKKRDKLDEITNFFNSTDHPEWLHISQIMNEKWLNASASMKSILEEMDSKIEQIKNDVVTLSNLPEFGFEAIEVYKSSLDINKALNEGRRLSEIQKRKAEHEAEQARLKAEAELKKAEPQPKPAQEGFIHPPVEEAPAKQWVSFSALLSTEDALALKAFFDSRQIEFKAI